MKNNTRRDYMFGIKKHSPTKLDIVLVLVPHWVYRKKGITEKQEAKFADFLGDALPVLSVQRKKPEMQYFKNEGGLMARVEVILPEADSRQVEIVEEYLKQRNGLCIGRATTNNSVEFYFEF